MPTLLKRSLVEEEEQAFEPVERAATELDAEYAQVETDLQTELAEDCDADFTEEE